MSRRASGPCRCHELGEECASCRAAIARRESDDGEVVTEADYSRLEAGPWWNTVPA